MKSAVKIVLYIVLLAIGIACGIGVKVNLAAVPPRSSDDDSSADPVVAATNATAIATNLPSETNAPAATNEGVASAVVTNLGTGAPPALPAAKKPAASGKNLGRAVALGGVTLLCMIGLGLLISRDVTHLMAGRLERFVFNDDLEGVTDPEYEEAENVWKAGRHLEAVQLMRDYYKRHPSEVYVALRIAEIYEADLRNYVASALEYEEILKKKLPAERWGWAAIHLANLYSGKLDKPHEATLLLRRIVDEFGQTAAARKARERLGIPEPIEAESAAPGAPEGEAAAAPAAAQPAFRVKALGQAVRPPAGETITRSSEPEFEPEPEPEPPRPSLPPGFRPKK